MKYLKNSMKNSLRKASKTKSMSATGTIIYTLWTVAGDIKLKVNYGIQEREGQLNLGFIEISIVDDPYPLYNFSSKIDEEMQEIVAVCIQDYEARKKEQPEKLFPEDTPKDYLKAHQDYHFSAN